jgi:urea transport system permease protein
MRLHQAMRCAFLLVVMLAAFAGPSTVRADAVEDALLLLSADSFEKTQKGIEDLARSGSPVAEPVLSALAAGRLFVQSADRTIVYRDADGLLHLARTGSPASIDAAGLKPVRLNNRLRRVVDASLGSLTLLSPDPAQRIRAAQAVFKSRETAAFPTVETALARETDMTARRELEGARASLLLAMPDAPEADRIAAVQTLSGRGNDDAAALLRSLPVETSPAVRAAAEAGVKRIEQRLALWASVQNLVFGISLGSVLLLAAVGLAITFGQMGVINMAHGEMVMLGAYTTYVVQEAVRSYAPGLVDWSLPIAVPLAFLVAGSVGVLIERTIIRFLYGRPLETLLATFGLSLILQQAVRSLFGAANREVGTPGWMSGSFDLGGLSLTYNRVGIILFSLAVFAALLLVLRRTPLGLQVRAVTQNRRMAAAMGIKTDRIDALTFGLGSGVAGMAGLALSQIDNVSPNLGQGYIIDSFMVVVFGGVGNLWGTLVGAVTLGIANKLLEPVAGAVLGKIVLLVAIILFIQKRPRGLFALKGRSVEA